MIKNIEVCLGYNCRGRGSKELKERLERVCKSLDYKIGEMDCTGHCSHGPNVRIDDDIYPGDSEIFLRSNKELKQFLMNYQSTTRIEGPCEPAENRDCGLAIDIGTTLIKASLSDVDSGDVLGEISTINKQGAYGATVQHRWNYFNQAEDREGNLESLSKIIQKSVEDIIDYFVEKSGAYISKIVLAGNTAMTYFFLNEDPCLTLEDKPEYTSKKFQNGRVLLPCIFEWVGGDIVAGMTYLGFDRFDKNIMLIDLGTNGEVALSTKDKAILVASASAGPAFEGEGFRCGMPAMNGAIYEVSSDRGDTFSYNVIGQEEPLGLCGSGMLDLIAEMLANRIMDKGGRLDEKYKGEFFLTGDISVKQEEINYFKNSKAAIFATIQTVLQEAGLSLGDLDTVYVAGGFGSMNIEKAQLIGLLPPFGNYKFMGNTSLKGAQCCLREENLERAAIIANASTPLTLTKSDTWGENYKAARFFPHTDIKLFDRILKKHMK